MCMGAEDGGVFVVVLKEFLKILTSLDGSFNLDILNTLPPPQTSGESTIIKTKKPRTSESLQSKRERTEPVLQRE